MPHHSNHNMASSQEESPSTRDKKLCQWLPYIVAIVSTAVAIVLALTLMIYDYSCNTCEEKLKNCQESCSNENEMNTTAKDGVGPMIIIFAIIAGLYLKFFNGRNNNEVVFHGQRPEEISHMNY